MQKAEIGIYSVVVVVAAVPMFVVDSCFVYSNCFDSWKKFEHDAAVAAEQQNAIVSAVAVCRTEAKTLWEIAQ